jgi:archaellin
VLDQFVKDTSLLIKDGKTWMSIKEEKAAKLANDSSIIASEAANTKNGKFEYSILDDKTQSMSKTKKALTNVKKAWKNITMRDSVGNYFDSYARVFDRMF